MKHFESKTALFFSLFCSKILFYNERIVIFVYPKRLYISHMNYTCLFRRFFLLLLCGAAGFANAAERNSVITISGKVIDAAHRRSKPIDGATVQLSGIDITTITNQDGVFLLKVPLYAPFSHIEIKQVGYSNLTVKAEDIDLNRQNVFALEPCAPYAEVPDEEGVESEPVSPEYLIERALVYIGQNYVRESTAKIAFYRESVKKKREYLSLAEAILDISKASYSSFSPDLIRLYKARKITGHKEADTLLFKFESGIPAIMSMDMVKRRDLFFDKANSEWYNYQRVGTTGFDNRRHYIVAFDQASSLREMLYRGEVYIDAENYAVTRIKFELNVEDSPAAAQLFMRKQPDGARIKVTEAAYLVDFRKDENGYSFHSARLDVKYRCKWKGRAIASTYAVRAEMIVTNEVDQHLVVRDNMIQIHAGDILIEKIGDFEDAGFWDAYNIIEPDKTIGEATKKLLKRKR